MVFKMAIIQRLLLVLLVNLFVANLRGQELSAELLRATLPWRMSLTSAVYDGEDSIYIIGGFTINQNSSKEILKFSLTDERITHEATLPSPRCFGRAAIDNKGEKIYYFGGWDNGSFKREIYELNIATKSVTVAGNLNYSAYGHAVIKYTNESSKVFIIGGQSTSNLIQCWDIDLKMNCPITTMDTRFYYPSAVSNGNEAFVFGKANLSSSGVYKINLDSFETSFVKTTLPNLQYVSASVIVSSKNAYIVGGWLNEKDFLNTSIMQVNLDTFEATQIPIEYFVPNFYEASVVYVEKLNRIYVFGGNSKFRGFHDEIWTIDLSPIYIPPTTTEGTTEIPSEGSTFPTSTTMDPSLFTCVDKMDGFYPHPFDCAQFIGCRNNGITEYYTCPQPLLFNPVKAACDFPDAVNCEITCVDKPDGMYPHPQDCSLFIGCHDAALEVYKCPQPLLFDPIEGKCNFPDIVECLVQY